LPSENLVSLQTTFVATRGVQEYRATIPACLEPDDSVLEIGCQWGPTTACLAHRCRVLGTDISPQCIDRARADHPDLEFAVLDGFDVRAALALERAFTAVYVDMSGLSGYRGLLDVIALLQMYATVLRPRLIVVKSGALKRFLAHSLAWPSPTDPRPWPTLARTVQGGDAAGR